MWDYLFAQILTGTCLKTSATKQPHHRTMLTDSVLHQHIGLLEFKRREHTEGKELSATLTHDTCLAIETSMRSQQSLFPEHVSNMLDECGFMNHISHITET